MAWESHKRKTYEQYVREVIGDCDSDLFTTDELASYIDKWSDRYLTTAVVRADNNKYYLSCSNTGDGVRNLVVSDGITDAVYVLDEPASLILFDTEDPENLAVAPVDGTTIEVTYYSICTAKLISELFFVLSSNHTKLTSYQSIMGVKMDLKDLADAFYNQSIRWIIEA